MHLLMGNTNSDYFEKLGIAKDVLESEKYYGFINFGNTCYCNSILQALYYCRPFREKLLIYKLIHKKTKDSILFELSNLFFNIATQKKTVGSIAPKRLVSQLRKEYENFNNYLQQDAHEFFNYLLNDISETLEVFIQRSQKNIFTYCDYNECKCNKTSESILYENASSSTVTTCDSSRNSALSTPPFPLHSSFKECPQILSSQNKFIDWWRKKSKVSLRRRSSHAGLTPNKCDSHPHPSELNFSQSVELSPHHIITTTHPIKSQETVSENDKPGDRHLTQPLPPSWENSDNNNFSPFLRRIFKTRKKGFSVVSSSSGTSRKKKSRGRKTAGCLLSDTAATMSKMATTSNDEQKVPNGIVPHSHPFLNIINDNNASAYHADKAASFLKAQPKFQLNVPRVPVSAPHITASLSRGTEKMSKTHYDETSSIANLESSASYNNNNYSSPSSNHVLRNNSIINICSHEKCSRNTKLFNITPTHSHHDHVTTTPQEQLLHGGIRKFETTTNFVKDIFQGQLSHETRCLNCESITCTTEVFFDISVDVVPNTSILNCLRSYSNMNSLMGENKYECKTCNCKQEAHRRTSIKKLPIVLVLHLKRFKMDPLATITDAAGTSAQQHFNLMTCNPNFNSTTNLCANGTTSNNNFSSASSIINSNNKFTKVSHKVIFPLEITFPLTAQFNVTKNFDVYNNSQHNYNSNSFPGNNSFSTLKLNSDGADNVAETAIRRYELVAIVVHCGTGLNRGHYITIVKSLGNWLLFDDDVVETIDESTIPEYFGVSSSLSDQPNKLTSADTAYILFYQDKDWKNQR